MLVDFDLRKPRVAQYLGLKQEKSINDFLAGNAELSDIIVNPGIPHPVSYTHLDVYKRQAHWLARLAASHKKLDYTGNHPKGNVIGVTLVYDTLNF